MLTKIIQAWRAMLPRTATPFSKRLGDEGESAARRHLTHAGMKCLATNYRSPRGEIDLVLRDHQTLVFVEVKTRSDEQYGRPASAVSTDQKQRIAKAALDYLRELGNPPIAIRFDIVEVLAASGGIAEIRHLPNAFGLPPHLRYG